MQIMNISAWFRGLLPAEKPNAARSLAPLPNEIWDNIQRHASVDTFVALRGTNRVLRQLPTRQHFASRAASLSGTKQTACYGSLQNLSNCEKNFEMRWRALVSMGLFCRNKEGEIPLDGKLALYAKFSPDGRFILTVASEAHPFYQVKLWDLYAPRPEGVVMSHRQFSYYNSHCAQFFNADRGMMLWGTSDGTEAEVWNLRGRRPTKVVGRLRGASCGVSVSPDQRDIAATDGDGKITIYTHGKGTVGSSVSALLPFAQFWSVSWSPSGDSVVAWGDRAATWSRDPDAAPIELAGHEGAVKGAAYAPDGQSILTLSSAGVLRNWVTQQNTPTPKILRRLGENVAAAFFSPTCRYMATATEAAMVRIYDLNKPDTQAIANQRMVNQPWGAFPTKNLHVAFSPNEDCALISSVSATWFWDLREKPVSVDLRTQGLVNSLEFSPDGRFAMAAAGGAKIWEVSALRRRAQGRRLKIRNLVGATQRAIFATE